MKNVIYSLKNWRVKRNITQEQAASMFGINARSWAAYERKGEIPLMWYLAVTGKYYDGTETGEVSAAPDRVRVKKQAGVWENQIIDGKTYRIRVG